MKVYYEVVHDLKDFPKEDIMMIHMNEYSSIYKYYILSSYKRSVCTFVYPIVYVLFASIVIYILYIRTRGDLNFNKLVRFVESDESPI